MSDSELQKILIIDDNSDYRKLIKTFIDKLLPGVEFIEYDPLFEGVPDDNFNWAAIDVLLLDYHLSIVGTTGLDILQKYHKKPGFPATIMLTAAGTEEVAISALKFGIHEYQPKQSLTKDKLKQSIIHAWEEKIAERKKKKEITQHNRSFSKEVFYENLSKVSSQPELNRVLIVIKPDKLSELEQLIGIIGRDNLINHIGKNSLDVFKLGACNPNITRISDDAIAVQIDHPGTIETLEFNMKGLCKHLEKCTFKFSDEKYNFTVSIGVLELSMFHVDAEQLIQIATDASERADKDNKNSFYIWKETDGIPETTQNNEKIEPKNLDAKTEAKLHEIEETKKKLEEELKATAEAKAKAEADQAAKQRTQNELKAAAEAKAKAEAELKAKAEAELREIEETKKKLDQELKAAAEAKAKAEAELRSEQEAKAKAEAELKAKAEAELREIEETKKKLDQELKAAAEAKAKAEAELRSEQEAKAKAEAELRAKAEAELREIEETKKKLDQELKAVAEAKAKAEAELQSEQEAKAEAEAELRAKAEAELQSEQNAKEKAETEEAAKAVAETKAANEAREKLDAELKAIAEAKAKAEAEMKAIAETREKLEAELKAIAEAKKPDQNTNEVTKDSSAQSSSKEIQTKEIEQEEDKNKSEANENIIKEETEELIKKLITEKKIIQAYQPVIAMSETDGDTDAEVYNTKLQTITNDENINTVLTNFSAFTLPLQQTINELILRQIFLRITERGTESSKFRFLVTVTEAWFSDATLFTWLQKILSQTKKYSPGKSIILQLPLNIFLTHQKRAQALITTLVKSHFFTIALSDIDSLDNFPEICKTTLSRLLILNIEQLQQLNSTLSPESTHNESEGENSENKEENKTNLINYLKMKNIHIITTGIENATLLTDAISLGTNYVIGDFVGEFQDSLVDSSAVESFELT